MITVVLGRHTRGIIHGLYYTGNKLCMEYIIYKIYCLETILEKEYIREYVIESIILYLHQPNAQLTLFSTDRTRYLVCYGIIIF